MERADGTPLTIQLVGLGVIYWYIIQIDVHATRLLDIGHGLLKYRQRLKTEKVHFYKPGFFDDTTFVLSHQQLAFFLIIGRGHGHPIGDVISAYDNAAGMHSRIANIAFESTRIAKSLAYQRI